MPPPASLRATVVVPVYNPGPGFDDLLASLDQQTLDPAQFEVILCDDGSDAPTRARLAQAASTRSNVRVLTLPHTGWPGTPRNQGIDAARGTYVFFSDQDDRLFASALEDLCDYADRLASDVVIGKVVGVGRRMPGRIFRRDIPRAVLGEDPLLELLTPHKLFRTQFLRDNAIRFPDGRVRLEDHLFVMQAYFRASVISILASTPCYAWLKNKGSASSSRIDPESYFPHLETVLDLVEANTEPGRLRDRLLRHWYRGKILQRLDGRRLVRYPDEYRERLLDVVIPLAERRFGDGVERGLAFPHRIRSALLRDGRREDLMAFARFEAALGCRAEAVAARWTRGGRLALTIDVRVAGAAGAPLAFGPREAGGPDTVWQPPPGLGVATLPREVRDARRDLRDDRVELFLRDGRSSEARRVPGRSARVLSGAELLLDPTRTFRHDDPSGGGTLVVRVRRAGWTFETDVRADSDVLPDIGPSPALAGRRCHLEIREDHTLALRREWPEGSIRDIVARGLRRMRRLVTRGVRRRRATRMPR